jgi:tRNA (mo5U34)-methyltransferase
MQLLEEVNSLKWWHSIDFGNGVVSPGIQTGGSLKSMSDIYFDSNIAGKSVLDFGAWDGFHSVEALKRGAKSVTAVDTWDHWGNRRCISLVQEHIAPELKIVHCNLYDLTPEKVPVHDIVLFAGVLYHLRHPLLGMEKISKFAGELLIVETHCDGDKIGRPAMIMYPGAELDGDSTNWWGPNRACVEAMLRDAGFANIRFTPHPAAGKRGIFHARRS